MCNNSKQQWTPLELVWQRWGVRNWEEQFFTLVLHACRGYGNWLWRTLIWLDTYMLVCCWSCVLNILVKCVVLVCRYWRTSSCWGEESYFRHLWIWCSLCWENLLLLPPNMVCVSVCVHEFACVRSCVCVHACACVSSTGVCSAHVTRNATAGLQCYIL